MKCAIIAGNESEARAYARNKHLTDWFFVKSPADLDGRGALRVEMTGSWFGREDRAELAEATNRLKAAGLSL